MITAGLIAFLLSQSPVTALCSTRIFPATGPVGAIYPQIVAQQISGQEDDTFDGALGMGEDRYQLTCWAETYAASEGLAKAVITALNGTAAAMGSQQALDCEIVGQHDILGEAVDLALRKYGKQVDVKIVQDNLKRSYYMASVGQIGKGTTLSYGATPTLIGQLTEFNGPAFAGKVAEITNMDSPVLGGGVAREVVPGEGSFTMSAKLIYIPATGLDMSTLINTSTTFTLKLPKMGTQVTTGDSWTMTGVLTKWDVTGTTAEKITGDIEIEISGVPVFAAGA